MVIPIGNLFDPKIKICPELTLAWDRRFKLLGIHFDNRLQHIDENFDMVHSRTLSLINDWKSRRLPLEGRISISKCLLISQYTYISTIIPLKDSQISKAQQAINNFIMNIKENERPWISKEKIYQPIKKGGLNCIELTSFFKGIKLNWMKRYISENYNNHWTEILDSLLEVSPTTRGEILKWGSEKFTTPIISCKFSAIKALLQCMQELTAKFVTPPERGDNRFIFQPLFQNPNLKYKRTVHRSKKKWSLFSNQISTYPIKLTSQ